MRLISIILLICILEKDINCSMIDKQNLLIKHVKNSIELAQIHSSKLTLDILNIGGMSSAKVRHLLNNICSLKNSNYLEIGVWKGSTFISALYGNKLNSAIAIDNWSLFDGPKPEFMKNVEKYLKGVDFSFYEVDSFNLDLQKIFKSKINIYFYDGSHLEHSHYLAFTYFNEIFENVFIAIIDDYNFERVKIGTQKAFNFLHYKVLYEKILPANFNGDTNNWWNGLYVAVIAKQ